MGAYQLSIAKKCLLDNIQLKYLIIMFVPSGIVVDKTFSTPYNHYTSHGSVKIAEVRINIMSGGNYGAVYYDEYLDR
jgi:hypothetical protein